MDEHLNFRTQGATTKKKVAYDVAGGRSISTGVVEILVHVIDIRTVEFMHGEQSGFANRIRYS